MFELQTSMCIPVEVQPLDVLNSTVTLLTESLLSLVDFCGVVVNKLPMSTSDHYNESQ